MKHLRKEYEQSKETISFEEWIENRDLRIDSITGEGMTEGFCFLDGQFYCECEKEALKYAQSLGYESLKQSYEMGAHYWTTWED